MSGTPYLSSEDSALLRKALEGRRGGLCLEIGAGNGGTLVRLAEGYGTAVGTDLARPDMEDWRARGDFVLADLGSCFRDGVFDLVAFNPPYLAEEGSGDRTVEGGARLGVPLRFLEEALRVVKKTGSVVFLLNQDAGLSEFKETCRSSGFVVKPLVSTSLFFERLTVYEAASADGAGPIDERGGSVPAHWETSTASLLHQVPASPS